MQAILRNLSGVLVNMKSQAVLPVTVPFNDLHLQYQTIKTEIDDAIAQVIRTSAFIRGPFVEKFEQDFSRLMGVSDCVSCANGTDALYIAMKALNIQPGDEVIVPAHSWISSASSVKQAGGKVVFCDTDSSYTIDPEALESKITSRTVGIIPVHLYGQPANMDEIMRIASKNKLWVVEDCAQAHLARYKGKLVGTFGDVSSFSFYPGKNLGAMGDAGAILTNDQDLARRMAMYARHGGLKKGDHQIEGVNSRLDGIQAAILSVKLPHLLNWTRLRQGHALRYSELLSTLDGLTMPRVFDGREHVWHLYVIRHDKRDELAEFLNTNGVQTVINYPVALPFLPAYKKFNYPVSDFPNAYANQSRILSLPIYPEMTDEHVVKVTKSIAEFCSMD